MSRTVRFASTAALVAALTLAARIVGFGRSLVFSQTVADTCLGDVYNAANQLPNVLFEIVAGGVLAGVVVPVVARHVAAGRRAEAAQTSAALVTWTLIVLTPAALAALAGARRYADALTAPSCVGGADVGAALLMLFVPQIWLYGLAVVSAGILQAHHRFIPAALAPLLSSAVVITSYLIFATLVETQALTDPSALSRDALRVLGWGTTAGVAVLALSTMIPLARLKLRLRPQWHFAPGDASVIIKIAGAGLLGLIMQQLTMIMITWTAKQTLDPGAITRITWANAIYLLPFAVLVTPVLQLIFPRLTAAAERGVTPLHEVLRTVGPPVCALAGLGAALLVAVAFPIARVFVSGPGSGRTAALAWPIAALAPAVLGFALLNLATRTQLAAHRARSSGITTVVAWAATAAAVGIVQLVMPTEWVVTGIAGALSLGMLIGAGVGWWLVGRQSRAAGASEVSAGLLRTLIRVVPIAGVSGIGAGFVASRLAEASVAAAILGGLATAVGCTVLYVGCMFVLDRALLAQLRALRRPGSTA